MPCENVESDARRSRMFRMSKHVVWHGVESCVIDEANAEARIA